MRPERASQQATAATAPPQGRRLAILSLAALGVVYGDIGTSPLYALRECFHGEYGIAVTVENVLGVLSLMFWALFGIVAIKYLTFILRADNQGEGGIMALVALLRNSSSRSSRGRWLLIGLGIFGASLLYGDGMITPAISVLSAVEGIRGITPALKPYVIPLTAAILIALFMIQRRGTGNVGRLFGPVTLVWFTVIAVLGIRSVVQEPHVLAAVNPYWGARFLANNHMHGFLVLGAVFLVVTGAEALYADLGHFGRRPIRLVWWFVVWPALLCSYFGQGALLIGHPEEAHHPFYGIVPAWLLIPMVVLATAATIIASQAVISGAFSLTRQAIQLGYLPRLRIIHTSREEVGQIFVPQINTLLMVATLTLVIGFQTSSKLAAAYGVAVTTTMLITTLVFYVVARTRWHWGFWRAATLTLLFLVVDLSFFAANLGKITHGAWFPLAIGAVVFVLLTTWNRGRATLAQTMYASAPSLTYFLAEIKTNPPLRVPGNAVFLAGMRDTMPPALLHNVRHNHVLHSQIALLTIVTESVPFTRREEKVEVAPLEGGFYRVVGHYGFMEEPNVPYLLALAREQGLDFELKEISFFLGRERVLSDRHARMPVWRQRIFGFLSRNAQGATDFFHIPPEQVVELGAQVKM